jgi:O-antigen/teichoic acid export membrane protein
MGPTLYARRVQTAERPSFVSGFARTDTGRAAGLGVAVIATNVIALVFTVVMARVLGATDYGSLAALLSAFIILMVPGSALQIAVAREVSTSLAAGDGRAGTGVRLWLGRLLLLAAGVAVVAVLARGVLAAIMGVDQEWAAAAVPVTAVLWMALSVERGALQGFQRYKLVAWSIIGEAAARLGFALVLVGAGGDVTGAFLGTPLSLVAVGLVLAAPLSHHLPGDGGHPLRDLLAGAWMPMLALTLLFVLQEVHVIVVKHEADGDAAGAYAVAAVAAKAIIWVAVGLGMYLLPETARRSRGGEDARPILRRTLALIAVCAVPMVLIYAAAGEPLLGVAFGEDLDEASGALPWLGLAMALLACSYLSVQFLLAMHRHRFVAILAVAATAEVIVLLALGAHLTRIAIALFAIQLACAACLLTVALRTRAPAS